jgi:hypothetical protein
MKISTILLRGRLRLAMLLLITVIVTIPAFAMYCQDYYASCADGTGGYSNVCCGDAQVGFAGCACGTWTAGPWGGTYSDCSTTTGCYDVLQN